MMRAYHLVIAYASQDSAVGEQRIFCISLKESREKISLHGRCGTKKIQKGQRTTSPRMQAAVNGYSDGSATSPGKEVGYPAGC
jgi:hypothetical protein